MIGKKNQILIIFFAFFTMLTIATVQVLESSWVAGKLKKIIKNEIGNDISVDFHNIEFGYFPPKISVRQFSIATRVNEQIEGQFDSLSLEYSPIDIIVGRPVISNLELSSGRVNLSNQKQRENADGDIKLKEIFLDYKNLFEKLPIYIKRITFKNAIIETEKGEILLESLNSVLLPTSIYLKADVGGDLSKIIWNRNVFDYVSLDSHLTEKELTIRKLEVLKEMEKFSAEGTVSDINNLKSFSGKVNVSSGTDEILQIVKELTGDNVPEITGYANGRISVVSGEIKTAEFDIFDFEAKFARANEVSVSVELIDKVLKVTKLEAETPLGGTVRLLNTPNVYIAESPFTSDAIELQLNKVHSNDFLYIAKKDLEVLKTRSSGIFSLQFNKQDIHVKNKGSGTGEFLKLLSKDKVDTIFDLKEYQVNLADALIDRRNGHVNLNVDFNWNQGNVKANGTIKGKEISFVASTQELDFEDFGHIGTVDLKGSSNLNINVIGHDEEVKLIFSGKSKNFTVIDYFLGDIEYESILDLKAKQLIIKDISGEAFQTKFEGSAKFQLGPKASIDLDIRKIVGNRIGVEKIYQPLIKDMKLIEDLNFIYDGSITLQKRAGKDVIVQSSLKINNLALYGEVFEDGNIDLIYKEKVLNIERFNAKKGRHPIIGSGSYNTASGFFEVDLGGSQLPLVSFTNYSLLNFGMKCNMSFEFYISGNSEDNNLRFQTRLSDCLSGSYKLRDSLFTLYRSNAGFVGSGKFLGDDVQLSMTTEGKISNVPKGEASLVFNIDNLKDEFAAISEHNSLKTDLSGKLKGRLKVQFNGQSWDEFNLEYTNTEMNLKNRTQEYYLSQKDQVIKVEKGAIQKMLIEIKGTDSDISLMGKGNFKENFTLGTKGTIDANLLELLSSDIEVSSGMIDFEGRIEKSGLGFNSFYNAQGNNFALKHKRLPIPFTEIGLEMSLQNNLLLIDKVTTKVGKGTLSGSGKVLMKFPFPEINLDVQARNVNIPIHTKSFALANSELSLTGKKPPYLLRGSVDIFYASIEDELSEIPVLKSIETDYNSLIPRGASGLKYDYIDLDLRVQVPDGIRVKNSLMDIRMQGSSNIRGGISKPNYDLRMNIMPNSSRVLLKNHEFVISKGSLLATDDTFNKKIELDLEASSRVQGYDLRLLVTGEIGRLRIDLSSSPALSQEDIVSLLTLGVTSDVSKGLKDKDRTSITTIGVGSLLFDQLKINQNLNSSMGLKLSLQPEFKKQDDNLFESRSDVKGGNSAGYKSTTKLKVQKQITPKMDVSLSSSLGDTTDQSQEMNVNYELNKKLSLEGVYEIKSDEQNENQGQESLGADIKYKWSF
ncbi:MAG: hypothetical protein CO099_10115 [Bdellovibrio sp. CG_4_9_14_3_um_filter_39_7]|nr:MAG: hypothetical protein CO099_10115 [Bdellovibrio sp. CG_4_9_14_3_um_filter_39_7]